MNPILTVEQLRQTIEAAGQGEDFTRKLEDIAKRTDIGRNTLFRYLREGMKRGPANTLLVQFAREHEVL